jgi:hypothetical protein
MPPADRSGLTHVYPLPSHRVVLGGLPAAPRPMPGHGEGIELYTWCPRCGNPLPLPSKLAGQSGEQDNPVLGHEEVPLCATCGLCLACDSSGASGAEASGPFVNTLK